MAFSSKEYPWAVYIKKSAYGVWHRVGVFKSKVSAKSSAERHRLLGHGARVRKRE